MHQTVQRLFSQYHDYDVCVYQICFILIIAYILKAIKKRSRRQAFKSMLTDIPLDLGQPKEIVKPKKQQMNQEKKQEVISKKVEIDQKTQLKQHHDQFVQEHGNVSAKGRDNRLEKKKTLKQLKKVNKLIQLKLFFKVQHQAYLSAVKGFSQEINDFSFNEKYICACDDDKTIKLFEMKDFIMGHDNPQSYFHKLQDNATAICISQNDDKIYFGANNQIHVLKFNLEADDKRYFSLDKVFNKKAQKEEITNLFIVMLLKKEIFYSLGQTYGSQADTWVKVWNLNGDLIKDINTSYGQHYHSSWNLIKNHLLISSWSSDSSIFECKCGKDNSFKSIEKVMLLRGEKGSIIDVNQSQLGNKAILIAKDVIKIFNTNVNYAQREDPHVLKTINKQQLIGEVKLKFGQRTQLLVVSIAMEEEKTNHYTSLEQDVMQQYQTQIGQFKNVGEIENAASGSQIKRLTVNKDILFVWGENQERINVFKVDYFIKE